MRLLKKTDICRGKAKEGKKQDLCGWIIEFFGENSREAFNFSVHLARKAGCRSDELISWSDDASIKTQVKYFNDSIKELKILEKKAKFRFHKILKNGKVTKKYYFEFEADSEDEAWKKLKKDNKKLDYSRFVCKESCK